MSPPSAPPRPGWGRALRFLTPFLGLGFILLLLFLYDLLLIHEEGPTGEPVFGLREFLLLFSPYNLKQIAVQTTTIAVGALGMTVIIVSGGIDLSPGSVIALGTVVIALLLEGTELPLLGAVQTGPALAALAGVVTCGAVGVVNGLLITKLRLVPFIVTLGMMSVARGAAKWLSGEMKISVEETWLSGLLAVDASPDASLWRLPPGIYLLAALALVLAAVLRWSVFGRRVFAIGSNERTAVLCGVRVDRAKLAIYGLAGLFVGVSAVLEFSVLNSGDPTTAVGRELDLIAAVVIGGGSLSGGRGSVLGTLIGALIIGLLRNGGVIYGISDTVQEIGIGTIIIAAAAVDQLQLRRRAAAGG